MQAEIDVVRNATSTASPAIHGRRARTSTTSSTASTGRWPLAHVPRWLQPRAEAAVGLAGLVVFAWGAGSPSAWRDEAATISVTRRSFTDMAQVFEHADLVHAAYYVLAHLALTVSDTLTAVRMLSVLAFAGVAVMLVRIGRVLGTTSVGVTAACLVVASPLASRYAQDARPFATVTLAATWSTYALLVALSPALRPATGRRAAPAQPAATPSPLTTRLRRGRLLSWPWLVYAGSLVVLGAFNVLALLLLMAHAAIAFVLVTRAARRAGTSAGTAATARATLVRWATYAGAALVVLLPFVAATLSQRGQVDWIRAPHAYDLTGFYVQHFQSRPLVVVVLTGVAAVLVLSRGLPSGPAGTAFVVGALWAALPPVVLWSLSQVKPLWDLHYVVFCLPGTMLLIASLPALLSAPLVSAVSRWRAGRRPLPATLSWQWPRAARPGLAALVVLVAAVAGLPQQAAVRDTATGHVENLRGVAAYLRANVVPGDGVMYSSGALRTICDLYPATLHPLDDVALAHSGRATSTIAGVETTPEALPAALRRSKRVWLIRAHTGRTAPPGIESAKLAELHDHFLAISTTMISTIEVSLYVPQ